MTGFDDWLARVIDEGESVTAEATEQDPVQLLMAAELELVQQTGCNIAGVRISINHTPKGH